MTRYDTMGAVSSPVPPTTTFPIYINNLDLFLTPLFTVLFTKKWGWVQETANYPLVICFLNYASHVFLMKKN